MLGFPCNQFLKQEPATDGEIQECTRRKFKVEFPILAKTQVNGDCVDEVFRLLKKELPGFLGTTSVKWNFTKFLIARDGSGYKRYSPHVSPESCNADIEKLLAMPWDDEGMSHDASSACDDSTLRDSVDSSSTEGGSDYRVF